MAGVYISYPFCAQKCTYCNFTSGVFPAELRSRYQQALLSELSACEWPWTPETLYLGGGTPSQMDGNELGEVLACVPGYPWREATIEAAPGDLTPARADEWRHVGINRVSFGVQSFVEAELRRTGRKHTAAVVHADVERLRSAGIENISVDLIAGLAGQTMKSWRESLDCVETLEVPHVSIYMLEIDEDSRLGLEILRDGARYGAQDVPGEAETADMYELAVARLDSIGLRRYEISNFAKEGMESLHNLKYWTGQEYLGFGADAHSFANGRRWSNRENAFDYVESGVGMSNPPTGAKPNEERFFLGLRLMKGIQPDAGEWKRWEAPIERFVNEGLLEQRSGTLRLTSRGVLLSNEVFAEFLES